MFSDCDYDERNCGYGGCDNTVSGRQIYCSGWCGYREEERGPMKRQTMQNIINNWDKVFPGQKVGEVNVEEPKNMKDLKVDVKIDEQKTIDDFQANIDLLGIREPPKEVVNYAYIKNFFGDDHFSEHKLNK